MSYITGTYNGVASTKIYNILKNQRSGLLDLVYKNSDDSLMIDELTFNNDSAMTVNKSSMRLMTDVDDLSYPLQSSVSTVYAGTNRTRINPTTGYIENVGANISRIESVGGSLATLIEPASTNKFLYSNDFSEWTQYEATISSDATTSPDGTVSADKLVVNGTTGDHSLYVDMVTTSFDTNSNVTHSVYAKKAEYSWMFLNSKTKQSTYPSAYFNLNTGATGTLSAATAGTEDMGDGWWRCWMTHSAGTSGSDNFRFTIHVAEANDDVTIAGDSSSGIYIWGTQAEQSVIPTSLIHTTGSAVTRATESSYPRFTLPTDLFDNQGTVIFWWRPAFTEAMATADGGLVSVRDNVSSLFYYDISGNGIASHDGSTEATDGLVYSANTWYKLAGKWGYDDSGKKFKVGNGDSISWGTAQTFDNTFTLGSDIIIGHTPFSRMHLRNLRFSRSILTDEQINNITS